MSWISKLFGKSAGSGRTEQESNPPSSEPLQVQSYGDRLVAVPALDIMGEQATSRSGKFQLIWQDRRVQPDGSCVRGRYVLLDQGRIRVQGEMDRPHHGKVADDGTFVLNDWGSNDALAATFWAFTVDGEKMIERHYSANLLNNGLADDGHLAICQTCNSPGSPDSSILSVFDLDQRQIIAEWTAESGWANAYGFPGGEVVSLLRHERATLRYSLRGDFIDRPRWFEDEVARGSLYVIRKALEEGEDRSGRSIPHLRAGVHAALASDDKRFVADAWRLLGEIEEAAGDEGAALIAYDKALAVNPRIGVAKRATKLRKARQQAS